MDEIDLDTYILEVQTVNSTGQIAQLYRGESDDSEENIVYFHGEPHDSGCGLASKDTTNVIMRPHIICDDSEEESLTSILIRFSWALPVI